MEGVGFKVSNRPRPLVQDLRLGSRELLPLSLQGLGLGLRV